jgi:hypothetical protein
MGNGNPFTQPPDAPPGRNRLGIWLTYRKLMTIPYVPSRADRARLWGSRFYQAVIQWELDAQQTDSFFTVTPGYFGVFGFVGSSQQPEGVQVSLFDPYRNRQLTESPMVFDNFAGSAKHPFIYPSAGGRLHNKGGIYIFQPNTQILAKIANLSMQANSGQIVALGRVLKFRPNEDDLAPVSPAQANIQQVQEPPWIKMPHAGEPFNPTGWVEMPPIGATVTIVSHTVGTGRCSVMNRIGNQVVGQPWVDGDGTLIWQITRNGVPVKNQEYIISSMGPVAAPSAFGPILFIENDVAALTVKNVSILPNKQLIGGRFDGWDYPKGLGPSNIW